MSTVNPTHVPANAVKLFALGRVESDVVRIGATSGSIAERAREYGSKLDEKLEILAFWWGTRNDHRYLLEFFKRLRHENEQEWFDVDHDMEEWLRYMATRNFTVQREEDLDSPHLAPFVDATAWLPTRDNVTAFPILKRQSELFELFPAPPKRRWHEIVPAEAGEAEEGDLFTPPEIIECARACLGVIDLDPASCKEANRVVGAERYYDVRHDGLNQRWYGNVWISPPLPWRDGWTAKLLSEIRAKRVKQAIALVTSRGATAVGFADLAEIADAVLIPRGRFSYWGPKATKSPPDGLFIFYFGDNPEKFSEAFEVLGTVFTNPRKPSDRNPLRFATRKISR